MADQKAKKEKKNDNKILKKLNKHQVIVLVLIIILFIWLLYKMGLKPGLNTMFTGDENNYFGDFIAIAITVLVFLLTIFGIDKVQEDKDKNAEKIAALQYEYSLENIINAAQKINEFINDNKYDYYKDDLAPNYENIRKEYIYNIKLSSKSLDDSKQFYNTSVASGFYDTKQFESLLAADKICKFLEDTIEQYEALLDDVLYNSLNEDDLSVELFDKVYLIHKRTNNTIKKLEDKLTKIKNDSEYIITEKEETIDELIKNYYSQQDDSMDENVVETKESSSETYTESNELSPQDLAVMMNTDIPYDDDYKKYKHTVIAMIIRKYINQWKFYKSKKEGTIRVKTKNGENILFLVDYRKDKYKEERKSNPFFKHFDWIINKLENENYRGYIISVFPENKVDVNRDYIKKYLDEAKTEAKKSEKYKNKQYIIDKIESIVLSSSNLDKVYDELSLYEKEITSE